MNYRRGDGKKNNGQHLASSNTILTILIILRPRQMIAYQQKRPVLPLIPRPNPFFFKASSTEQNTCLVPDFCSFSE